MAYTLGEAARAVGRSKTTLGRAIKSGRISATRGEDGSYLIDPAELHRVFAVTRDGHPRMERSVTLNGAEPAPSSETLALRQLLAERERLVDEQGETIRDLRGRLDDSEAERRRTQERLTGLLTHRQAGSVPSVSSPTVTGPRAPWWRRLFGGLTADSSRH
jgi:hypothetical protein